MGFIHTVQTKIWYIFALLFKLHNHWFYEIVALLFAIGLMSSCIVLWKKTKRKRSFLKYPIAALTLLFSGSLVVHLAILGYLFVNKEQALADYAFDIDEIDQEYANIELFDQEDKSIYTVVHEGVNRDAISINEVPAYLKEAFVSVEDKTFYQHSGVSVRGYLRAFFYKLRDPAQAMHGGSTITQQLVKNIKGDIYGRTVLHKYQEAMVAVVMENHFEKDEILEMYLNRIYLGKGTVYGIGTASKVYFDKEVSDLSLAESAFLAGLPKAPSVYTEDLTLGNERKNIVLDLMKEQGVITESQWKKAREEIIVFQENTETPTKQAYIDAYADYVLEEARTRYGLSEQEIKQKGYQIYTYLDRTLQAQMSEAVANFSFQDGQDVQVAMAAIDNNKRTITALYGGNGYVRGDQNRATARYQPGSILKPLVVYGPALETGKYTPYSEVIDEPTDFGGYTPKNAGNTYEGTISLKRALIRSANIPAVSVLKDIGVEEGVAVLEKLGIPLDEKDKQLHLALGGMEKGVTPLEMAQAYAVLPNYGYFEQANSIKYIKDEKGHFIEPKESIKGIDVFTPQTAHYLTEMLQQVVTDESGTGKNAQIGRALAGKTGTAEEVGTSGNRDAWFVGYTPEVTVSVHMGFDQPSATHYLTTSGGGDPARLFSSVVGNYLKDKPKQAFAVPDGVNTLETSVELEKVKNVKAKVDKEAGQLTITWTPSTNVGGVTYRIYKKGKDGEDEAIDETSNTTFQQPFVRPKMEYLPLPTFVTPSDGVDAWRDVIKTYVTTAKENATIFWHNHSFEIERYYVVAVLDGKQSEPSRATWTFVRKTETES